MIVRAVNGVRRPHKCYVASQVWRIVQAIPASQRARLAQDIQARANLLGSKNEAALRAALKCLRKEQDVKPDGE